MEEDAWSQILAILLCIVGSALFSSTETALTSLSHRKVQQMLDNGKKSPLLELWLAKPNDVLTTILIGNNIVNILASSLATRFSYQQLQGMGISNVESFAVAVAVGVMTLIILIFGEVVPKTYAKHNAEAMIPLFLIIYAFYYPFLLITKVLVYISRTVVWITGGKFSHEGPLVTEEDIEWMIRRGTEEKSLDHEVGTMLAAALDLEDTVAREIMVPRTNMVMFEVNETLAEIWEQHKEHNYSRYPVYDEIPDKIIGIFYIKDLLYFLVNPEGKTFRIRDLMRTDVYFIPESKNLSEVLAELKKRQMGMGIVIDEFGGVSGIVSLEDIIEEMVGEIYDEYDEPAQDFVEEKPGCFRVEAKLLLADLETNLPFKPGFALDKGYDTVGGLLMDLAGEVPKPGEVLTWPKNSSTQGSENATAVENLVLSFTILEASETKIDTVRMEIIEPKPPTQEGAAKTSDVNG
ncbi:MAG: HlyC/CorC family transporter [Deltaproteobacteria bacterium]|nr:HlyC/CorC family transporter [Deltaproteobacteria bacterium]